MTNQSTQYEDDVDAWCKREAASIFDFIRETLGNNQLLADFGFKSKDDVKRILILVVAGDGLHPIKGPNFLGDSWPTMDEAKRKRAIAARNRMVNRMMNALLGELRNGASFESVIRLAEQVPYPVLHLSHDEKSLAKSLKALRGLGVQGPFDDTRRERIADALLFGLGEYDSYFMDGS